MIMITNKRIAPKTPAITGIKSEKKKIYTGWRFKKSLDNRLSKLNPSFAQTNERLFQAMASFAKTCKILLLKK